MRISIALTTFNGEQFLGMQLDSYLAQDRAPDELVVQDDASEDGTCEVVRRFAARAPFPVRLARNDQRLGVNRNFPHAFSRCTGDLVLPCDQDDVWCDDHVAALAQAAQAHPNYDLFVSNSVCIDEQGRLMHGTLWDRQRFTARHQRLFRRYGSRIGVIKHRPFAGHGMAVRREALAMMFPGGDLWDYDGWMCLMAGLREKLCIVDRTLTRYRLHRSQTMGVVTLPLPEEVRKRRRLPDAQFDREADRWTQALSHVQQLDEPTIDAGELAAMLAEKITLLRDRAEMRRRRWKAAPLIARNLVTGRYHRVGRGMLTVMRDVVG